MRNPIPPTLVLAAAVILAGCNGPRRTPPPTGPDAKPTAAPRSAVIESPAPVPVKAEIGVATQAPPTAELALDGEGLRIFAVATGSSRPLPFGTARAETLRMLEVVEGAPPSQQGENPDCGATNAIWPDGLTVWFARDRFVGWSVASADSPLSTAGGLKVGITRKTLQDGAAVATITPSSIGEEFTAGGIGGLLGSARADARVTHLWAGAVCIAR